MHIVYVHTLSDHGSPESGPNPRAVPVDEPLFKMATRAEAEAWIASRRAPQEPEGTGQVMQLSPNEILLILRGLYRLQNQPTTSPEFPPPDTGRLAKLVSKMEQELDK